jgi:hypothetical protein
VRIARTGPVPGDIDGDGTVEMDDAMMLESHLLATAPLTPDQLSRADPNVDSRVDVADLVWIVNAIN